MSPFFLSASDWQSLLNNLNYYAEQLLTHSEINCKANVVETVYR